MSSKTVERVLTGRLRSTITAWAGDCGASLEPRLPVRCTGGRYLKGCRLRLPGSDHGDSGVCVCVVDQPTRGVCVTLSGQAATATAGSLSTARAAALSGAVATMLPGNVGMPGNANPEFDLLAAICRLAPRGTRLWRRVGLRDTLLGDIWLLPRATD